MAKTERTKKSQKEQQKKGSEKTPDKADKKDEKPKFDYEIKCLLLDINKGDVIKVVADTFEGDVKVMAIDVSDFEMTLKTKVLNEVTK